MICSLPLRSPSLVHRVVSHICLPSRNLLLRDWVIANTWDANLIAARTAGKLLITPVLPQATAIASAHIAEIAALARLASRRNAVGAGGRGGAGIGVGVCGGIINNGSISCALAGTGIVTMTRTRTRNRVRGDRDTRVGCRGTSLAAAAAATAASRRPS